MFNLIAGCLCINIYICIGMFWLLFLLSKDTCTLLLMNYLA